MAFSFLFVARVSVVKIGRFVAEEFEEFLYLRVFAHSLGGAEFAR
jgi:hypothetical protein